MSAAARAIRVLTYLAPVALAAAMVLGFTVGWGSTATLIALSIFVVSTVAIVAYVMTLKRNEALYRHEIACGLNSAYEAAGQREEVFDLATGKLVVFSDQHKGTRDGADDFWRCERAYCSALAYYLETGHPLVP